MTICDKWLKARAVADTGFGSSYGLSATKYSDTSHEAFSSQWRREEMEEEMEEGGGDGGGRRWRNRYS